MSGLTERQILTESCRGFVGSWVARAADSRSLRRRLMATLRLAYSVLGASRKKLGLGTLAAGGGLRSASAIGGFAAIMALGLSAPAHAQYQAGGGSATAAGSIAIGTTAAASVLNAIALGTRSTSSTQYSVAIGQDAQATGTGGAVAIGGGAISNNINTVALGVASNATGAGASALGTNTHATGGNSTAVGAGATASNNYAFATGYGSVASGLRSIALGQFAEASGLDAVAQGTSTVASQQNAIAVGFQANATALNSLYLGSRTAAGTGALAQSAIAIGTDVTASQADAIAMGRASQSTGTGATAIGTTSRAWGNQSIALGLGAIAGVQANTAIPNSIAIGTNALSSGGFGVAIGQATQATADFGTAVGNGAGASGQNASAFGSGANATGDNSLAAGVSAGASGIASTALGIGANASATSAIAIGNNAAANSANAVAMGTNAVATGGQAVSIGANNTAYGDGAVAIGDPSFASGTGAFTGGANNIANADGTASATAANAANGVVAIGNSNVAVGQGSVAIGNTSRAGAAGAVALGDTAVANNPGDVALGSGSVTAAAVATPSTVIGGTTYTFVGINPTSTVSVGAVGAERTITNVAAGRISGASTDAINGSQLFATNQQVTANTTAISNLGGAITDIAGDTSTSYTDANGKGIRYVRTNETGLAPTDAFAQGQGSSAVGYGATATAADALALGRDTQAGIVGGVALGAGSIVNRALAPTSGQISAGPAIIEYNTTDKTLLGAVSVGTDTSYRQITNVADGTQAQDAVTIRQLQGAIASVAVTPTQYFHANSAAGDSLAVGAESIAVGPTTVVNGNNGIGMGNGAIVEATAPGGTAIGQNAHVMLADGVALGTNSTAAGVQSIALGAGATSNHANSVAVGGNSITTVGAETNYTAFALAGPQSSVGEVSFGSGTAKRKLTNVAGGSADTDAVNVSQLRGVTQNVANFFGGTTVVNPDGSITGPTYNIQGNTYTTVSDSFEAVDNALTNINTGGGIKYFHANSTLADSTATGLNSVAAGPTANAIGDGSVAIGFGSVANNDRDVAIGQGSTTTVTTAVGGATIGGTNYAFAGATPSGAFSVGSAGQERQIQNVAAGQLTSSSTDAINGSQLFATNQQVTANTTAISNLGGAITDIAGDTSTSYTDANGKGIRYVRTNETGLAPTDAFAQGQGSSAVGYGATATAADALALGRDTQAGIVGGVALGAGSIVDRPLAPATGTLPAGPATIVYNTTDQTLLGAVSVGHAGAYRQITNVADGTQAQDAVTIRQLQGAIASVAVTPTQYFHANSAGPDSLAVGLESIAVGPRTVVNGNNGIGMGNGAIVEATAPGGTAIGQNAHVIAADGLSLGTNSQSGGVQSVAIGAGAVSNHSGSVALGAGSVTQAAVGTSSTTINGKTYAFAGTAPVSTVSVGDVGAERTITNVAAGRLSATSTDAVNGSQLYAANTAIEDLQAGVGSLTQNTVQYETNVDGSKKNSIVLQGGDPNAPVLISNVAAGVKNTDAVNVKQLNDGIASSRTYTDQVAATTLNEAKDYTDSRLGQLNQQIGSARQEARQGAAIGLAAASLRYDDRPGKLSASVGGGVWRGEGAFALGAGYTSEDGRLRANLSAATAGGEWGAGAGISFTLN